MALWLILLFVSSVVTENFDEPITNIEDNRQLALQDTEDYSENIYEDVEDSEKSQPSPLNYHQKIKQFAKKIFDSDSRYGDSLNIGKETGQHPRRSNSNLMQLFDNFNLGTKNIFKREVEQTNENVNKQNTDLNSGTLTGVKDAHQIVYLPRPEKKSNHEEIAQNTDLNDGTLVTGVKDSNQIVYLPLPEKISNSKEIENKTSDPQKITDSNSYSIPENTVDEANINNTRRFLLSKIIPNLSILKTNSKDNSHGSVTKKTTHTSRIHPHRQKIVSRSHEETSKLLEQIISQDISVNTLINDPYKNDVDCKMYLKNLLRIWNMLAKFIAQEVTEEPNLHILPNLFKLLSIYTTLNSENTSEIPRHKLIQKAINIITKPPVFIDDHIKNKNKIVNQSNKEYESQSIDNIFDINEKEKPFIKIKNINDDSVELPPFSSDESAEDTFKWDLNNSKEIDEDKSEIVKYKPEINNDEGYNVVISQNMDGQDGIGLAVPVPKTKCQETALGALVDTFKKLYDEYVKHVMDCENINHRHKSSNTKYLN